ncbi:lycopene cyclase domain-containing protein [Microbacterium sp. YJN-G]|uniref:lycopene cyclase domain-containing protein n=1 Tax=Microbacterium sp. YJN-G TaxID=2763257 RepID=UPI0018783C5F|nr:lycopene cyclase domain-containing protein [Microbacterium sp. YJN-G]
MNLIHLTALLVSLTGIVLLDVRHRLFLGRAPGRALLVLTIGTAFFLLWDLAGIGLGVFFRAESPYATGILLAPELPLEEPVFLLFLCQLTMVLVCGAERMVQRRRRSRRPSGREEPR